MRCIDQVQTRVHALTRPAALSAALLLGLLLPLTAQAGGESANAVGNPEIEVLAEAALRELSREIVRSITAPKPVAWQITVPDTTVGMWRAVRDRLYDVLKARRVLPSDLYYRTFYLYSVRLRGDTLIGEFLIGDKGYCAPDPDLIAPAGGGWIEPGYGGTITATRLFGYWQEAKVGEIWVLDGGCMYNRRRK